MKQLDYKSNKNRTLDYVENFDRERVLKSLIDTDEPLIFDVGAAVGQSLSQFKNWWPNCEVHCFEPQKEFYDELKTIPYKQVVYNNFALGDKSSPKEKFYTHKVQPMLGGFDKLNVNSKDSIAINKPTLVDMKNGEYLDNINDIIEVEVRKIENYMLEWGNYWKVDILKMDTQGWESKVLKGAGDTLSRFKIVLAELNFYDLYEHQHSFSELEKYLLPHGFKLFDISHISKNPMNGRTDWVDVVYVRSV
mgnify:CR=1 FL=1